MWKPICTLPALMLAGFFGLFLAAAPAFAEKAMSVQIRKAELRSGPSYLAKPLAQAVYGDRLFIDAEKGPWRKVRNPKTGKTGWLHQSALTPKTIKLTAGDKDVALSASSDELQLAGKGFNKQVEEEFKNRNRDVSFEWVDRMSRITVSQDQKQAFLQNGRLTPREDAK
ncbi:MAG: SH3 domain-containing protein [Thermodesulfobacteriota bacterium]